MPLGEPLLGGWGEPSYIEVFNKGGQSSGHQRVLLLKEKQTSQVKELTFSVYEKEASLVAQLAKNPPAMQETLVRSRGREDPLEEGMATRCSILAWRSSTDRGAWWCAVPGVGKNWTRLK